MKKRIFSLLLAGCISYSLMSSAFASDFDDNPVQNIVVIEDESAVIDTEPPVNDQIQDEVENPAPDESDYAQLVNSRAQEIAKSHVLYASDTVMKNPFNPPVQSYSPTKTYRFVEPDEYSKLKKSQQKLYDEIFEKIQNLEPFVYTAKEYGYTTLDNLYTAQSALFVDHPEVENYFVIKDVVKGNITTALKSHYFMPDDPKQKSLTTPEELADLRYAIDVFETVCDYVITSMPDNLSTYDKYRYLATYISHRTRYDYSLDYGWQVGTPYGSIISGHSICQGYAEGMLYLCKKANLYCEFISGSNYDGEGHAWNLIRLPTGKYHVDITWSDNETPRTAGTGNWLKYFALTEDEITSDHKIDYGMTAADGIRLPKPAKTDYRIPYRSQYLVGDFLCTVTKGSMSGKGTVSITRTYKKTPLTSITVPSYVTINGVKFKVSAIDNYSFRNCKNLTSVTVGKYVKSIGIKAFYNDRKLKTIDIKSSYLNNIGTLAVSRISKYAVITVPSSKKAAYKQLFSTSTGFKNTMKIT